MYVPPHFRSDDHAVALELMRDHPFAVLVAATGAGEVEISHLPILAAADGDALELRGHVARANPMARLIEGASAASPVRATVVFSGPQAYVSPDWYETENQVPTWNYLAVHAGGILTPVADGPAVDRVLADLSAAHEAGLAPKRPWTMDKMVPGTVERMRKGITAFTLTVDRLETKAKLSQNKRAPDLGGVVAALEALGRPDAAATAAWMRRLAR
jgi:transcriptional regulator